MKGFTNILLTLLFAFPFAANAQVLREQLPLDPSLEKGVLDNGLTYYVRHNGANHGQAAIYLVVRGGSLVEEESERGLAHVIEHLCFDETEHFGAGTIDSYFDALGLKQGEDVNASTSTEETTFFINHIPTHRAGAIDSCLMIVRDWAHGLSPSQSSIEKERNIIREEWRSSSSALNRMHEQLQPCLFGKTRLGQRHPIGKTEVVDGFTRDQLLSFYSRWYRPDLQAVIVVGDFEKDEIVSKLKHLFSPLPRPLSPALVYECLDETGKNDVISIASDKEQASLSFVLGRRMNAFAGSHNSRAFLRDVYCRSMIGYMLSTRLAEIAAGSVSPFFVAETRPSSLLGISSQEAFLTSFTCNPDMWDDAVAVVYRELLRARRHGFTPGELARIKSDYTSSFNSRMAKSSSKSNVSYAADYKANFLQGEPAMDEMADCQLCLSLLPQIGLEQINRMTSSLLADSSWVCLAFAPQLAASKMPTEKKIREVMETVSMEEIAPYVDMESADSLFEFPRPTGGKIVRTTKSLYGATEYELSNGVRFVLKRTSFKDDEIVMSASRRGGTSLFPASDKPNYSYVGSIIPKAGYGGLTPVELAKVLSGTSATAQVMMNDLQEQLTGHCSSADLETMLRLVWLKMTAPNADSSFMPRFRSQVRLSLQSGVSGADEQFSDSVSLMLFGNNPRLRKLIDSDVDSIDFSRVYALYRDCFSDAYGFTFFFVGNVDSKEQLSLIVDYLGSLPSTKSPHDFFDNNMYVVPGRRQLTFTCPMPTPKSVHECNYSLRVPYSLDVSIKADVLGQILESRLSRRLRETNASTYDVTVDCSASQYPKGEVILTIFFETSPDKFDAVRRDLLDEMDTFCKNGPSEAELHRVTDFLMRYNSEHSTRNSYWLNAIDGYYWSGIDELGSYSKCVSKLSTKSIREFASSLIMSGNCVEVTMNPQ